MEKRVAVGLSGGVDSSVAAALLIDRGYEVTGVYISCWSGSGCRDEEDKKDALDVALQLGMPFVHLDFRKKYQEKVFEYMMAEYGAGRTPNPDAMCNREIKFGLFYAWSLQNGFDFVATGHYAQIDGMRLMRSGDEKKDQTYFLWQLKQEQLAHILFPIGHLTKAEVRAEAGKRKLLTAKKPDSQGICFIGEVSVSKFLEERIEKKEGRILLSSSRPLSRDPGSLNDLHRFPMQADSLLGNDGIVIGAHRGVWFYTIGQKIAVDQRRLKGFDQTNLPHFYVVGKDVEKNILYVGTREQLYVDEICVGQVHLISKSKFQISKGNNIYVRIRHMGELVRVNKIQSSNDKFQIKLHNAVWGVAPGQSAVFYFGEECLGGGIIRGK